MSDANKKYYFTQIFQDEVESFLSRAVKDQAVATIWQKGQEKDDVEEFTVKSFTKERMTLTLDFNASILSKLAGAKNKDKKVLIKITYGPVYIFSNSTLVKDPNSDFYFIEMNNDVFKSQQRSNYRLNANRYIKIQFKIDNEVFDALDISAGGTSFIVPIEMKERFAKGKSFENCVIRFANTNFELPIVKIAGTWDHEYKDAEGNIVQGLKLGVAFSELPKNIEENLFLQINLEARGEEIRKKALEKKTSN